MVFAARVHAVIKATNAQIAAAQKKAQKAKAARQLAAQKAAVKRKATTRLNPRDKPYLLPVGARDTFINPGAPDLGTGIEIYPEGDLAPLVFINPGAPELSTGKQTTPIADQGPIINTFNPDEAGSSLPDFVAGGPTSGRGVAGDETYELVSGNKKADAELISIVNERLRTQGLLPGTANSGHASDVEQKFAAIMLRDQIGTANLVINNPKGPCPGVLGCDNVLNSILGKEHALTVYWPGGPGGTYLKRQYGGDS